MKVQEQLVEADVAVDRREFDDRVEIVVDFGPGTRPDVDVVGETVILLAVGDQYELTVDGDAQAFNRNGVVTIEVHE